jgi:SAM-dependent methyltransferase
VEEVPFITTPDNVTAAMLELAVVKAGDHVIDLGSGDGRIVIAAARLGATGLGVEIDPRLVESSVRNATRAGVAGRVKFLEQDLFKTDLSAATVVTMYLLPEVNLQLRPSILSLRPGTRIVSHDWDMGDWAPDRTVVVEVPEKSIGLEKRSRVHLWIVPARVEGLWCGAHGTRRASLRLRQSYQRLTGEIAIDDKPLGLISGRLDGANVVIEGKVDSTQGRMALSYVAGDMESGRAEGAFVTLRGLGWRPANGATCAPD